jgi:ligand-binding SRPBCC domain-containing protein
VLGTSTPRIGDRTLIDYKLRIKGLPVRWRSRIEEWRPGTRFVDTQVRGPYRKWHHTHTFEPVKGGTLMTDRVLLGGRIRRDIETIFKFRRQKIREIFRG